MLKFIIAVLIFGVIIFVHELGHFAAAKLMGIRVLKFAIGMGPKLVAKQIGETEYSVRVFPLGGFCAMEGEETDVITNAEIGEQAKVQGERSLRNRPVWQRFIVFFAGPFMNILLGFIIAVILTCMMQYVPSSQIKSFHTVSETDSTITAESYECGLREGDIIRKINGMRIFALGDLSYQLSSLNEDSYDLIVERDGKNIELNDVRFRDKTTNKKIDFYIQGQPKNPLNVLVYSAKDTISTGRLIWISLTELVRGKYGLDEISGPVGIVNEIGKAAESGDTAKESSMSLLSLTMFISVNLGIMNLLPIPGLDGGHIFLLIIEAIRRKPIKPEHEGIANLIGMGLVLLLIIVITFSDLIKLIG